MSGTEKAFGVIKGFLLMNERFDALEERVRANAGELSNLSRSHSELAQRVARIEGVMEGYGRAAAQPPRSRQKRLPKE